VKAPSSPLRETPYWDAVASEWAGQDRQRLWRVHADAVNVALLERWLPPGEIGRLLKTDAFDEAVGEGLASFLGQRAAVTLMDVSAVILEAASRRYPDVEAVCADARALPFEDGCFDLVLSNSTLDHFPTFADVERGLAELYRVLRPGGTLILTLDNLANPLVALRNALPFGLVRRLHLVPVYVGASCGPRRMRGMLDAAGFRIEETTAVMHAPRVIAVPLCGLFDRRFGQRGGERLLSALAAWEQLERLPTRFVTGHFVAARAVRA
jgi:SAM-dependent methyltransferase